MAIEDNRKKAEEYYKVESQYILTFKLMFAFHYNQRIRLESLKKSKGTELVRSK